MKYITNTIRIAPEQVIADNGEIGNNRVELWRGYTESGHLLFWLETGGDPILVREDNEYECAQMLGLESVSELKELY